MGLDRAPPFSSRRPAAPAGPVHCSRLSESGHEGGHRRWPIARDGCDELIKIEVPEALGLLIPLRYLASHDVEQKAVGVQVLLLHRNVMSRPPILIPSRNERREGPHTCSGPTLAPKLADGRNAALRAGHHALRRRTGEPSPDD